MKIILELSPVELKDGTHALVLRFSINRKTYRLQTNHKLTPAQWTFEQRHGYPKTKDVIALEEKAETILSSLHPETFSMDHFRDLMKKPIVRADSITKWWSVYDEYRNKKVLAIRTRQLDDSAKKKVDEFLVKHPELDNIHAWDADTLTEFHRFMIKIPIAVTSAKIYLEQFKTFFFWLINDQEILLRNPFKKFVIPHSENNWFPYSDTELSVICSVEPANPMQDTALKWTKMLLFSGGSDPKDLADMRWRQMKTESIQVIRSKVKNKSNVADKLLYLSDTVRSIFGDLHGERQDPSDFVFPIFKKENNESQNLENLKKHMKNINANMNEMLKKTGIEFTIKRLRPTAATIANNSTKDLNFVKQMLIHTDLRQTGTYLKRTPSDAVKKGQGVYEKALKKIIAVKAKKS